MKSLKETSSQIAARNIMGENFLGIPEIAEHLSQLSEMQIEAMGIIPYSEKILRARADTHVLIADMGFSIMSLREKAISLEQGEFWYQEEYFANNKAVPQWLLIRKPVSALKESGEGKQKVTARMMIYLSVLHLLAKGRPWTNVASISTCEPPLSERFIYVQPHDHAFPLVNTYSTEDCMAAPSLVFVETF